MGRFGVTVGFHVQFEKTAYWQRDVGRKLMFCARRLPYIFRWLLLEPHLLRWTHYAPYKSS